MRYDEVLQILVSELKRTVTQTEIANALNSNSQAMNKRAIRNSKFSASELKILEDTFNVSIVDKIPKEENKIKLKDIIDKISYEQGRHITREEVGGIFGVSRQRVTAMLNNPLPPHRIKLLEDAFGVVKDAFKEVQEEQEYINTPILGNVSASCGGGVYVYDEDKTAVYPISKQLFRQIGASQTETSIIFATGDSMQPEIQDGDALMVDTSKRDIIDGQIYIIRYDGQLLCKRLQKMPPKSIKVISDNSKYDAYYIDFSKEIDFDFAVVGRVLWYSRIAR